MNPKTPRGLRALPTLETSRNDPRSEYDSLKADASQIEKWWSTDRWKQTKRIYSAMDVASLRSSAETRDKEGRAPNTSFSNLQSEKLYDLLQKLHQVGGYSHTFGALDPVQAIQMAPHLSSVYVSGWQCSSTASTTNEPGPDFAGR